jgi:hypothetical protein
MNLFRHCSHWPVLVRHEQLIKHLVQPGENGHDFAAAKARRIALAVEDDKAFNPVAKIGARRRHTLTWSADGNSNRIL